MLPRLESQSAKSSVALVDCTNGRCRDDQFILSSTCTILEKGNSFYVVAEETFVCVCQGSESPVAVRLDPDYQHYLSLLLLETVSLFLLRQVGRKAPRALRAEPSTAV
jgi:hypothetical protein